MTDFSHTVSHGPERVVVAVGGELDTYTAVEFRRALLEVIETAPEVVVNLGGLTFTDSSGLSVFIAAHKRATALDTRLLFARVPAFLARILDITGLDEVLPVAS